MRTQVRQTAVMGEWVSIDFLLTNLLHLEGFEAAKERSKKSFLL